jgi:hypothetical protein
MTTAIAWPRSCDGQRPQRRRWDELLLPEIERQQAERKGVAFRADATFAKPEIWALPVPTG